MIFTIIMTTALSVTKLLQFSCMLAINVSEVEEETQSPPVSEANHFQRSSPHRVVRDHTVGEEDTTKTKSNWSQTYNGSGVSHGEHSEESQA